MADVDGLHDAVVQLHPRVSRSGIARFLFTRGNRISFGAGSGACVAQIFGLARCDRGFYAVVSGRTHNLPTESNSNQGALAWIPDRQPRGHLCGEKIERGAHPCGADTQADSPSIPFFSGDENRGSRVGEAVPVENPDGQHRCNARLASGTMGGDCTVTGDVQPRESTNHCAENTYAPLLHNLKSFIDSVIKHTW